METAEREGVSPKTRHPPPLAGRDEVDPEPAQVRESLPRVCASLGQVPGHRGAQPPVT